MTSSIRISVTIWAIGLFAARAVAGPPVPSLEHLTSYGCTVRPATFEKWNYQARAWAEHDGQRDWEFLLAEHQGAHARRKGLLDCDAFMEAVEKAKASRK